MDDKTLLNLVRKLNKLSDNSLANCVRTTDYAQWYLKELQDILEEHESNECEYCCGDPMRPLDWQYGLDHIFPDYKYCPMCGRKVIE